MVLLIATFVAFVFKRSTPLEFAIFSKIKKAHPRSFRKKHMKYVEDILLGTATIYFQIRKLVLNARK